jgi:2-haloalkanoic acid dehalogenase type II
MPIRLFTFDIFGTVLDWKRGLSEAAGVELADDDFDAVVDRQGELENEGFRPYAEIVAQSLVDELGLFEQDAARIGANAGRWPLFADSADALRRLRAVAPCAAITNSDKAHGAQVQQQLGFSLDGWICAEEERTYKPDAQMWRAASRRLGVPFSRDWWHVSAYADYDHATARSLGLTCVFVGRPHSRPGPSDLTVADLAGLAAAAEHQRG